MSLTGFDPTSPLLRWDRAGATPEVDAATAIDVALSGTADDSPPDAEKAPTRKIDLTSALEAQRRANDTPGLRQLRRRVEERVPPKSDKSPTGAPTLPQAAGGKGGLFSPAA